jgi:hypothetical protein
MLCSEINGKSELRRYVCAEAQVRATIVVNSGSKQLRPSSAWPKLFAPLAATPPVQ